MHFAPCDPLGSLWGHGQQQPPVRSAVNTLHNVCISIQCTLLCRPFTAAVSASTCLNTRGLCRSGMWCDGRTGCAPTWLPERGTPVSPASLDSSCSPAYPFNVSQACHTTGNPTGRVMLGSWEPAVLTAEASLDCSCEALADSHLRLACSCIQYRPVAADAATPFASGAQRPKS